MSKITIDPDKNIEIDGKKTFITWISGLCSELKEATSPCTSAATQMKDASIMLTTSNYSYTADVIAPTSAAKGMMFTRAAGSGVLSEPLRSHPNFFGYVQCDEPIAGTTTPLSGRTTQAICEATPATPRCTGAGPGVWLNGACYYPDMTPHIRDTYNNLHTKDPDHLVVLNLWQKMEYWAPYCDIISWDTYPYIYNNVVGGWIDWTREQSLYAYDKFSEQNFFKGLALHSIGKPVFAVIQAIGGTYSESQRSYYVLTPKEARANTYAAICMDVKGIGFWAWTHTNNGEKGLSMNPGLAAYYNQLCAEMKAINGVLVGQTLGYKWSVRSANASAVSFSKNLIGYMNYENWSWILKQGLDGKQYLIVVNKDAAPVANVTITVSGLNTSQVNLIGLEQTGSGATGRSITAQGNSFVDSFDGLAVHIYSLEDTQPQPLIRLNLVVEGNGAILIDGGINYIEGPAGQEYTVNALPDSPDDTFVKWVWSYGGESTSNPLTSVLSESGTLIAVFQSNVVQPPINQGLEKAFTFAGVYFVLKAIGVAK